MKEVTVKEFIEKCVAMNDEIGCDGSKIASHNFKSSISFYCEETDQYFKLKDMDCKRLAGCGCWSGIKFVLEKDE